MSQDQLHVIIQAGGRGSRLRHHTWNKPKCLVSIEGKSLLYHMFDRFPDASFTVIGDYAFEQLEKYLQMNPPAVDHKLIRANGQGTAAGIAQALRAIRPSQPLILVWSDLIVGELADWPVTANPVVCTTSAFTCRWTVSSDGRLHESPDASNGIPGLFYFPRAGLLLPPPATGEFVKWFADNIPDFTIMDCPELREVGDFAKLEKANDAAGFSRFFNKVVVGDTTVEKTALDPAYRSLIEKEQAWYRQAAELGFRRIPRVLSEQPFVMQRIEGEHLYKINDLSPREQRAVLADYLDTLISLHDKARTPSRADEVLDVYLHKTINRVAGVSAIIPAFDRESMTINGKRCRNVFSARHSGYIDSLIPSLQPSHFTPIHGDPTFSNSLMDDKLRMWFIDPRGYFSQPGIMGDPWYDFAKVYYSAVGGYDAFNRHKFKLYINNETVEVLAEEPRYAAAAREIFAGYFGTDVARIRVLHGLIWLALSGYVRDDADSVMGSFYLGLYWLETGCEDL